VEEEYKELESGEGPVIFTDDPYRKSVKKLMVLLIKVHRKIVLT